MPTILVLHDSPAVREMLRELLTFVGYTVESCPLVAPLMPPPPPNLIILDIPAVAPVSAWERLAQLTDAPATATIPLLVCSTYPPYLAAVQQPTFLEPFQVDDLLHLIATQLAPSVHQQRSGGPFSLQHART